MDRSLFGERTVPTSIPQQRVVEKLDEYMGHRDYAGAERHLKYWLDEAIALGDKRGELMVRNELVGHFRKVGDKQQALSQGDAALQLVDELGFGGTISAGTTYTNVATACNAFGENERALALFEKAAALYEASPFAAPQLLGGLCNNRALACVALGRFDEADELYCKALAMMAKAENGALEQAITYLNMADAAVARAAACVREGTRAQNQAQAGEGAHAETGAPADSSENVTEEDVLVAGYAACEQVVECYLDRALELLDEPSVPRDGYYAFVCEKCAPVFAHYGYFLADADLRERAQEIYGCEQAL